MSIYITKLKGFFKITFYVIAVNKNRPARLQCQNLSRLSSSGRPESPQTWAIASLAALIYVAWGSKIGPDFLKRVRATLGD